MCTMTKNKEIYFAPSLEVNEVAAEQGFAQSMFEDPIVSPEQSW